MNLKKEFKKLKFDYLNLLKRSSWKVIGIHLIYALVILFIFMFFLSALFAKMSPLIDKTDFLFGFKESYQATGEISPQEGTELLAVGTLMKQAITNSIFFVLLFLTIFIILKSSKELFVKRVIFDKKIPKKQWLKIVESNLLFILPTLILVFLMAWFFPTGFFISFTILIFLLFESLSIVNMSKNLFKWKNHITPVWLEHFLVNLLITFLSLISLFVVLIISNLLARLSVGLGVSALLVLLFLLYVKREVILFLVLKRLKG